MHSKISIALTLLLSFILPPITQANRELPEDAEPAVVLEAFFSELCSVMDDPANVDLGLNATYAQVDGYWIRTTREQVQQTGQVADLNAIMFFKFNRPTSWEFISLRSAGEFARAKVSFQPSASSGVVRDQQYATIDATFNLMVQNGEWYIVDFTGPKTTAAAPLPEAQSVDESDTPKSLASRFMTVVVTELAPAAGPAGSNLSKVAAATKNMWADKRDSRRSMGQGLAMMSMLQPQAWQLVAVDQQGDSAEITTTIESGSPMAAHVPGANKSGGPTTIRFKAVRSDGQWLLQAFIP